MINFNENDIQRTRRDELMRQAEQARAAAEAQQGDQHKSTPFYATSLARLGDVMVEVGSRLQERYGELVEEVQASAEATQRGKVTKIA